MHVLATVVRSGGELKVFRWLCAQSSYLLQYLSPLVVFIVSVLLPVMLLAVRIMRPLLARKTIPPLEYTLSVFEPHSYLCTMYSFIIAEKTQFRKNDYF